MNTSPQRSDQRVENGVTHFLDQCGVNSVHKLNYSGSPTALNLPTTTISLRVSNCDIILSPVRLHGIICK